MSGRVLRRLAALSLTLAVMVAVLAAGGWYLLAPVDVDVTRGRSTKIGIEIPRGAHMGEIAALLQERDLIRNALAFRWYARMRGEADHIHAGRYDVPRGLSAPDLLAQLVEGRIRLTRLVVPEGLTADEAAHVAASQARFSAAEYLALARDSLLADSLGVPGPTLEGYLFPETYFVDPAITAREFVALQARTFRRVFEPDLLKGATGRGMPGKEAVILASIIEAEARRPEERRTISAVYHNRLDQGMPLEADPTVQYALGGHRARVLYRDLEVNSPYNTYRNPGLPPGPINSPGRASLEAAVHPDSSSYLYFFWIGDSLGTHTFSRTYDEHLRKRAQLRR
ncbi:MAG: endolytic transglycosylase MltG [Gemmatimonadetes bacterium]|nr:endolytic transglycosylase MltG [Gemmatimonadota bacterium]